MLQFGGLGIGLSTKLVYFQEGLTRCSRQKYIQLIKKEGGGAAKENEMGIKSKGAKLSFESPAPCIRQ